MIALQNYGKLKGAFHFHRQACSTTLAIQRFHAVVGSLDVHVELPPVCDFEDTRAAPGLKLVDHMWAHVQEIEHKFGQECMIYTAGWWWDRWAKPYVQSRHKFYEKMLWEADPPPDTACGEWGEPDVKQVKLDIRLPGFNAYLDEDEATDLWFNSYAAEIPVPKLKVDVTHDKGVEVNVTQR
jgi:hypothetical protein